MEKKRGKGITHVSSLFEKYTKTLKAPQKTVCGAFIRAVQATIGVELQNTACTYNTHTKTISIKASGAIKSEILLHKNKILSLTTEELGATNAPKSIL